MGRGTEGGGERRAERERERRENREFDGKRVRTENSPGRDVFHGTHGIATRISLLRLHYARHYRDLFLSLNFPRYLLADLSTFHSTVMHCRAKRDYGRSLTAALILFA